MPLTTDTPQPAGPVPEADLFEVTGINIRCEQGTVSIYWRKSLRGEGDARIPVSYGTHVEKADVLGALNPDGGKTYYENLTALAYARLQAAGVFPQGRLT